MLSRRWTGGFRLLVVLVGDVASVATAQSLGLRAVGAKSGHELLGTVAGLVATAQVSLPAQNVRLVFSLERLTGGANRVGVPCGGLIDPSTCLPEPLVDRAEMTSLAVGARVTPVGSHHWRFHLGADLALSAVRSRTRDLSGALRLQADKTMWRLGAVAEVEWFPAAGTPLALVGGVGLAGLGPVRSSGLIDGYTPFDRATSLGHLSIGAAWHFDR